MVCSNDIVDERDVIDVAILSVFSFISTPMLEGMPLNNFRATEESKGDRGGLIESTKL